MPAFRHLPGSRLSALDFPSDFRVDSCSSMAPSCSLGFPLSAFPLSPSCAMSPITGTPAGVSHGNNHHRIRLQRAEYENIGEASYPNVPISTRQNGQGFRVPRDPICGRVDGQDKSLCDSHRPLPIPLPCQAELPGSQPMKDNARGGHRVSDSAFGCPLFGLERPRGTASGFSPQRRPFDASLSIRPAALQFFL
jgi:hypothetical protein